MTDHSPPPDAGSAWTRWAEVDALFERLLDYPPADRLQLLPTLTADPALQGAVARLLSATEDTADFAAAVSGEISAGALPVDEEQIGDRIGPFVVERSLGRGGMGNVVLASRVGGDFHQKVAIKVLRRGLDTDDLLARFRSERRMLAALRHPNIATLVDGGATDEGRPWLAMEYVDGVGIAQHCHSRHLLEGARVRLVRTVAIAVQEAHRNLIIHRDIKPANILVTADGTPKLLDFGIAKLLEDDGESGLATRTGHQLLTPRYAAPEVLRGERATTATDVYQLGLLLAEVLTGEPPPTKGGPFRPGAVIGDLATIIASACADEPARRYPSAGALAEELERWLDGRPILARPTSWTYRTAKFLRRNRWVAPVATALVLLLIGWGTSMTRKNIALERERVLARAEAERAEEVLGFVLGLFQSVSPRVLPASGQWRDLTVVDAMTMALERIRNQFADRPTIQAELLGTVAEVLWGLEVLEAPAQLAAEAERVAATLGDTATIRVRAMARLSRVLAGAGMRDSADRVAREVVRLAMTSPGRYRESHAHARIALGKIAIDAGDFQGALVHQRVADTALHTPTGVTHPNLLIEVLDGQMNALLALDSAEAAEAVARRALAITEAELDPRDLNRAKSQVDLAWLVGERGELEEAIRLYEQGLPPLLEAYGPTHSTSVVSRTNYATALRAIGRYGEGTALMQELVQLDRDARGASPSIGMADRRQNLGTFLLDIGDTTGSMQALREAAELYSIVSPESPRRVFPNLTLSGLALSRKDWAQAEREARTALTGLEVGLPEGHFAVEVARCRVGRALAGRGDFAAAIPHLRMAGQRLAGRVNTTAYRGECLEAWSSLERRVGRSATADSILALR